MREPDGTGKTLAAEVTPAEQRLSPYRIDLGAIVSKYIGETEKNLDRVFADAAAAVAVLFFDEADAIFGRRGEVEDAEDRCANLEFDHLVPQSKRSGGIAVLATSLAVTALLGLCLMHRRRRPQ